MKKFVALTLLLCMVLSLAACTDKCSKDPGDTTPETTTPGTTAPENTTPEITMQKIYDAGQVGAMFQNHQSVYIQEKANGEVFSEKYLTKEYAYLYYPDEEFAWEEYLTDDARYVRSSGDELRYLYIAPDGVTNDFTSERAIYYSSIFEAEGYDEIIESVTQKDNCITVISSLSQESLAEMAEYGVVSYKSEYTLDAKTLEVMSLTTECTYDGGTVDRMVTEFTYDVDAPEKLGELLKYANQTEDLRKVTIVSNPGTDKEVSQGFQIPNGLIVGFTFDDAFEDKVEFYTDAACTEAYDPYAATESALTVYVKWIA